jgi:hypothetical protein
MEAGDRALDVAAPKVARLGGIVLPARLDRRAHRALLLQRQARVRVSAPERREPCALRQVMEAV